MSQVNLNQNREVLMQAKPKKAGANAETAGDFSKLLNGLNSTKADAKTCATPNPTQDRIAQAVAKSAMKYDLHPALVLGVIKQESGFKPTAESHCGAQGLMQLMPGTAKDLGVTNAFSVEENIEGGCKYIRQMLDQFDGDVKLALAAYNAGPGNVKKHGGIPPFKETQHYVGAVLAHTEKFNNGASIPQVKDSAPKIENNPSNNIAIGTPTIQDQDIHTQVALTSVITDMISRNPIEMPKTEKSQIDEPPPPPPRYAMRV